jgi:hypothetical protein
MPTPRQVHDVKALRFARHSVEWIAQRLGMSVKTVRAIVEGDQEPEVQPDESDPEIHRP